MAAFHFKGSTLKRGANVVPLITNISLSCSIDLVDVTNLSSSAKAFLPGIPDSGEISFSGQYDPADTQHQGVYSDWAAGTSATWTITLASTTKTFAATGYVQDLQMSGSQTEAGTWSGKIKLTGALTPPA